MHEWPLAVKDLKVAVINHPAESHQQECVRWMLGAVQFWSGDQIADAIKNWDMSLEGMRKLAQRADQNNKASQKRWYRDRIVYMSGALKGKIKEHFSGTSKDYRTTDEQGGRGDIPATPQSQAPGSEPSQPRPHGPQATQTDRYQYLVLLVQGDSATAERLIEYERTIAPSADRSEWIERAIERLLRQRQ
jgi:hypothetical protein